MIARWSGWHGAACLALAGFVAVASTVPAGGDAGASGDGEALYHSWCEACHGRDLEPVSDAVADLRGFAGDEAEFRAVVLQGRGAMPAQFGLSETELTALYRYIGANR